MSLTGGAGGGARVGPGAARFPTQMAIWFFLSKELTVADHQLEMGPGLPPLPLQGALAPLPGT